MPLSIFEKEVLKEFAANYIKQFQYAIENKKVKRYTKTKKNFSAVVNSTGSLANSGEEVLGPNGIEVLVNDYIYWLIYGREPQSSASSTPPTTEIGKWMSQKGVSDLSVYQVAAAINKNGSSIWQFYKGQPSNLLEDINLDKLLADMQSKLGDRWAESITTSILKEFDNIESLNFEI